MCGVDVTICNEDFYSLTRRSWVFINLVQKLAMSFPKPGLVANTQLLTSDGLEFQQVLFWSAFPINIHDLSLLSDIYGPAYLQNWF